MTTQGKDKEDVPVLLMILNCVAYRHKADRQRATWLSTISIPYYHVLGDPLLPTEWQFDDVRKELWIRVADDYPSLPQKVIRAFRALDTRFRFRYLLKTDDDQQLQQPRFLSTLVSVLLSSTSSVHYGGQLVHVTRPHVSQYYRVHPELPTNLVIQATRYCSGRFYVVSADLVTYLYTQCKEAIEHETFEDYAIGYHVPEQYKSGPSFLPLRTTHAFVDDDSLPQSITSSCPACCDK